MANTSICKSYSCPFWSDGKRTEPSGSLGGYGCKKFSVAAHCPVAKIQKVTETQYELFIDSQEVSPNHETLISLAIAHLQFEQMNDPESRKAAEIKKRWDKD